MITTQRAATGDCREMAELLNDIIAAGGTTALTDQISPDDLRDWVLLSQPGHSACQLARDTADTLVGFQWIGPNAELPPGAVDIATFVRVGQTGLGIGSRLFEATRQAAERLGYKWINATIRSDNESGLIYYQSRGFRDWRFDEDVRLADGTLVNKISKRFDL
jgi:L-amino acid N-acyltransferase YncA